jgi:uncharacterized surface protein with fasciclin (FAS1) repeats
MQTIIETVSSNPNFSTLLSAIKTAELVDTLSGAGPFTVFAPTNAAFAKIPEDTLKATLADKDKLTKLLTYHVVDGTVTSADLASKPELMTLAGSAVKVSTVSGVTINNAKVTNADMQCGNGIVYVIDTVLMP